MEIIYCDKDIVVINKPVAMPSQADVSGDTDAMRATAEQLSSSDGGTGLWLVHRLDRVVGGVMVFARNRKYAAYLGTLMQNNAVKKTYLAVVDGALSGDGVMSDLILRDGSQSKAFIVDRERKGVKRCELSYSVIRQAYTEGECKTLVRVSLKTGRFHQIRAQFSHRHYPLTADKKYGSRDTRGRFAALFAASVEFEYKSESRAFCALPDITVYPWNLFSKEDYEI